MQDANPGRERRRRLQDLIFAAIDEASQLSPELIRAGVDAIVEKVSDLPKPSTDEVAAIVKVAFERTGESLGVAADAAGEVAGAAGDIAEKIVEGLAEIDISG